jgi:hypothetical protein
MFKYTNKVLFNYLYHSFYKFLDFLAVVSLIH